MNVRRWVGSFLVACGLVVLVLPLTARAPDDSSFLGILRSQDSPNDWDTRGSISTPDESVTFQVHRTRTFDARGNTLSQTAEMTATDQAGRERVYRRTRYFDDWGYTAESVEESPTRTIKKGRGRSGKDPYREEVVSDRSPLLSRDGPRLACHAGGGGMVVVGVLLVLLSRRGTGRAVEGASD